MMVLAVKSVLRMEKVELIATLMMGLGISFPLPMQKVAPQAIPMIAKVVS